MRYLLTAGALLVAVLMSLRGATPAERIAALIPAEYDAQVQGQETVLWRWHNVVWGWRRGVGSTNAPADLSRAIPGTADEDCLPNVLRLAARHRASGEAKALFIWNSDGRGHVVLLIGSKVIDPDSPTEQITVAGSDAVSLAKQVNQARFGRYGTMKARKMPQVAKARILPI